MSDRAPPAFALWLLKAWGPAYHSESFAGDLIEQYRQGRSRAWCWRQVAAAVVIGRAGYLRGLPWADAARVACRLIAEAAAVLALTVMVDEARREHSLSGATHPIFLGTLAALVAVAWIGFRISARADIRGRTRSAIQALMLAFGVIALGVGTLTWADTTHRDACRTAACVCPGN